MRLRSRIRDRGAIVVTSALLVLAVFFVPLAHSAHFHEGDGHGDASFHATCVVCSAAYSYCAECVNSCDFSESSVHSGDVGPEIAVTFHTILLSSEASRAPPVSV